MAGGVTPLSKWARDNARIRNEYITGFIGEYIGNFILCLFAFGAAASASHVFDIGHGEHLGHVFGGVFGLMIAVTVVGGLSGAHINPAVSLGLAISGHMSWLKLPVYWLAQFLGSYCGAGLGYGIYKHKLQEKFWTMVPEDLPDKEKNDFFLRALAGAGLFSPPPTDSPLGICFLDQIVTTAVLFMAIMSAIDHRNMKVPTHLFGIFFALVVASVGLCFGIHAGGSMNPARDFGPRLMAVTIGCKSEDIFKYVEKDVDGNYLKDQHYWVALLFGPLIGATVGTFIYIFLLGSHMKDTEEELGKKPGQDAGDWRSTVFLPKANQPSGPQNNNYGGVPPYTNGGPPNGNGPYSNGVQNPAYLRDDGRQRQY